MPGSHPQDLHISTNSCNTASVRSKIIHSIQDRLGVSFKNSTLIHEAFKAAGTVGGDSNKDLALIGDSALQLFLQSQSGARHASREQIENRLPHCQYYEPCQRGPRQIPERYARAILFFTKGYTENPKDIVGNAIFTVDSRELVLVKDIEISSLCEHHLMPFVRKINIGYIPDGRVFGLSKLARLAEIFARRLQLQERLTQQIANAIEQILKPQGVGVIMEASHMCMVTRGTTSQSHTSIPRLSQVNLSARYVMLWQVITTTYDISFIICPTFIFCP
ncbi:hypothetical protein ASPFODRAFT_212936 [Aspergillus luchuensis CBS 106.47]|uniref:GTP cyclohydrolase 1 n=1 Tax=Aspergillus luchuensis (strain CBS 106.47) TaxID=1137211 RepID=A0A1M3SZU1_ASPLC|nr:hypothetical protein ASPFODRAFT_212936 [Aspergillus luchuensis CBS 106.47]